MRKPILAYENIGVDATSFPAQPVTFATMDEQGTALELESLDARGQQIVQDLGSNQEAVAALEAMANHLSKNGSSSLGKTGAMFANIAVEQFLSKTKVSLEELPIDVRQYDRAPEETLQRGVASLNATRSELIKGSCSDLSALLFNLTQKREALNKCIRLQWHRIDSLSRYLDDLKANENADVVLKEITIDPKWAVFEISSRPESKKGKSVVSSLEHFLSEHQHLFRRLVKKQLDWIEQHKENVLRTSTGFDEYSFDPIEYSIAGATKSSNAAKSFYSGATLPGNKAFVTETSSQVLFGFDGAQALIDSCANLNEVPTDNEEYRPLLDVSKITALSSTEIQARLSEITSGLRSLMKWSDCAFKEIWKQAFFEEQILNFLMKEEAGSLNERGLSLLSEAIVKLAEEATKDVGQYALSVLSGLLDYVEANVAAGQEGDAP